MAVKVIHHHTCMFNHPRILDDTFLCQIDFMSFADNFCPWLEDLVESDVTKFNPNLEIKTFHCEWKSFKQLLRGNSFDKQLVFAIDLINAQLHRIVGPCSSSKLMMFIGYSWQSGSTPRHSDKEEVVGFNIFGSTDWAFPDMPEHDTLVAPGQMIYVPNNVEHEVTNHSLKRISCGLAFNR